MTRPRRTRAVLTAALAGASLIATAVLVLPQPEVTTAGDSSPFEPHVLAPDCVLSAERDIAPLALRAGDEITASIRLTAECVPDKRPINIVLLIDASSDMAGEPLTSLQTALEDALRSIVIPPDTRLQVGVVSFAETAQTQRGLTDNVELLVAGLRKITIGGDPCLSCGLEEALRLLRAGRGGRAPADLREVVLLISNGVQAGCEAVRRTAGEVKAFGVTLVAACRGRDCDRGCVFETASERRFIFRMDTWDPLGEALGQLLESTGAFHPIDRVAIEDVLSDGVIYAGGGNPDRSAGPRLSWDMYPWSGAAFERSYRVQAVECGHYPISAPPGLTATAWFNTAFWPAGSIGATFDNPELDIACVPATPSATPEERPTPPSSLTPSPSPTAGSSPSPTGEGGSPTGTVTSGATSVTSPTLAPTPTPSPTRSGDPSAIPRDFTVLLPLTLRSGCASGMAPLDVMLVVDTSYSMSLTPVEGAESAWHAAAAVSHATVSNLRPGVDRIGAVAFGDGVGPDGFGEVPVSACCAPDLLPPVEAFWRLDGSRVDRAIDRGSALLTAAGGVRGRTRALLIISDGDLNQTPVHQLDAALDRARSAGAVLRAVILGDDAGSLSAERVVTAGGRALHVPRLDPDDPGWSPDGGFCRR